MIDFELHKTFTSRGRSLKIELKAEFEEHKIIAVYGKSGAGKTSLLRMLAGLMKADVCHLRIGNDIWYDHKKRIFIKPNRRNVGFLFQDYSLFPNMSVLKNIKYGLQDKSGLELVDRIIEVANLGNLLHLKPDSLSGGQQQRVALARAIVRKPKLLLLDEPLSALDTEMRAKLQEEILAVNSLIDTTIVFVSHHLPEVFKLSDVVYLMEDGRFVKNGSPSEVFATAEGNSVESVGEVLSISEKNGIKTVTFVSEGKVMKLDLPI